MEHEANSRVVIVYEYRLFGEAVASTLSGCPGVECVSRVPLQEALLDPASLAGASTLIVECDTANPPAKFWGELMFVCENGVRVIFLDRADGRVSTWICSGRGRNVGIQDLFRTGQGEW